MSLSSNHLAHHAANIGFPLPGGGTPVREKTTEEPPKKRLTAEEKAEKALREESYGNSGARRSERGGGQTRVVRRRVRRRRVDTQQTQPQYGSSKTQQAQQTKQTKAQTRAQANQSGPSSNAHMMRRMNSQSDLNRMTSQFQNSQMSGSNGPQTPVGKKMAMLTNLKNYMENDYNAMKANDQDTAFTYRTSEARQLVATLGTMVASANKKTDNKKSGSSSSDSRGLSPEAFSRQKGLLRRLKAMSDPAGPMPEGLPVDYKPFESVA